MVIATGPESINKKEKNADQDMRRQAEGLEGFFGEKKSYVGV